MKHIRRWLGTLLLAITCMMISAGAVHADTTDITAKVRQIDGRYYLYNAANDTAVTGYTGIVEYPAGSGNWYCFVNTKGQIKVDSLFKKNGSRYYAAASGLLAESFTTVGSSTYYFNPDTHAAATGWAKINGSTYHFNRKGVMHTGLVTLNNKTYYFNPADNGARHTGWAKISGKWYYFSKTKGIMQKGLIKDPKTGSKYYLGTTGARKTGKIKIGSSYYYFDKTVGKTSSGQLIGGAMITGWKTLNGKQYYFSTSNGAALTGWNKIDGKTYYFTKNKGVMKTGWFKILGKKYYFGTDGVMQTGWITVGGKTYYLDSDGAMVTGKMTTSDYLYTFASTGELTSKEPLGTYSIKVNQGTNVVTIYRGSTAVKAMLCSVGLNGATPNGTFTLSNKKHWQPLFGGVYGQYTSTITGNILFHSVYYTSYKNDYSLATAEYNKLGSAASHGCVRLSCGDAYYIYTNCPNGTKVTIFRGTSADDPLGKPSASSYSIPWSGSYDPTDPIRGD